MTPPTPQVTLETSDPSAPARPGDVMNPQTLATSIEYEAMRRYLAANPHVTLEEKVSTNSIEVRVADISLQMQLMQVRRHAAQAVRAPVAIDT